jgi:hypothetical protein
MSDLPPNQPHAFGSPQPANWPPTSTQPGGPNPPKSGMGATKVILIVVGVFVVLGVLVVGLIGFAGWYMVKSVHKDANGQTTLNSPFGTIKTLPSDQITEKDLGIAIYPGAFPEKLGSVAKLSSITLLSAHFRTSDSADKVIAFYKDKAGSGAQIMSLPFGVGTQIQIQGQAGTSIKVLITQLTNQSGSGTRIQIDHATQTEPSK